MKTRVTNRYAPLSRADPRFLSEQVVAELSASLEEWRPEHGGGDPDSWRVTYERHGCLELTRDVGTKPRSSR